MVDQTREERVESIAQALQAIAERECPGVYTVDDWRIRVEEDLPDYEEALAN